MKALLALEDGTLFEGVAVGAEGVTTGEVVFNTSMTGYQEVLTDPSYAGQIVTMTCPQIGNYGVTPEDEESSGPKAAGFIVRDAASMASNWRATSTLHDYLVRHAVVAISGIDTRALTRRLRSCGVMRGALVTGGIGEAEAVERARASRRMEGADLASEVTCEAPYDWTGDTADPLVLRDGGDLAWGEFRVPAEAPRGAGKGFRIAVYDFGVKRNILRRLAALGCRVRVYPAATPAEGVLADSPDGIVLSNGPGDPAPLVYAVRNVQRVMEAGVPVFGICLGHQVLALALGGRTFKLKFGHRGGNHPVKHLPTGRVEITAQNHGFAVDPSSLPPDVSITHLSLYDGTVEGLRHRTRPVSSVQYHPEASPGPHDAEYLFTDFFQAVAARR